MEELGVERVFTDKVSGKNRERPELRRMMFFVREGDSLTVESISRFARNTRDLLDLTAALDAKGVQFISRKESIDTNTPTVLVVVIVVFIFLTHKGKEPTEVNNPTPSQTEVKAPEVSNVPNEDSSLVKEPISIEEIDSQIDKKVDELKNDPVNPVEVNEENLEKAKEEIHERKKC